MAPPETRGGYLIARVGAFIVGSLAASLLATPVIAAPAHGTNDAGIPEQSSESGPATDTSRGEDEAITADGMHRAKHCHVSRYDTSATSSGFARPVSMATSGTGWCWTTPHQPGGDGMRGGISEPPAHGQAIAVTDHKMRNRFAYKPEPGYIGPDHWKVSVYWGLHNIILDITVDVREE
jgi:hypothetical protein